MKIIKSLLILFTLTIATAEAHAQKPNQDKHTKISDYLHYCYKENIFNGALAVIENGNVIYKESWGNSSISYDSKLTTTTSFLLASLSKQFTATGIMLLRQSGDLGYDDLVKTYLPSFPYKSVTIRHLLNQTSGIPEYTTLLNARIEAIAENYNNNRTIVNNESLYKLWLSLRPELKFSPSTAFDYSNTNYVFLALIIEKVSGKSYAAFLEESIFKKLNMANSFVITDEQRIQKAEIAHAYKLGIDGDSKKENGLIPYIQIVGDGGILSNIDDLILWIQGLSNQVLISSDMINEATLIPEIEATRSGNYGFGWFIRNLPFNGNKVLTHSGEFRGYSNSFFYDVDADNALIMLSSNTNRYRAEMNQAITRIVYGFPYNLPKIGINEIIGPEIVNYGIKAGIQLYSKLKLEAKDKYDFSEPRLNRLGYDLIQANLIEDAIEVFKINVMNFKKSYNVYDSLGEAYFLVGNTDAALKNYEMSLDINPENQNAKDMISKIKAE